MAVRIKGDVSPLFIKVGVALAISFAGFLFSRLKTRKVRPLLPPPSPRSSDRGCQPDSRGQGIGLKEESDAGWMRNCSIKDVPYVAEKHDDVSAQKITVDSTTIGFEQGRKHSGDKEGFLLPEFNELVEELNLGSTTGGIPMKKNLKMPGPDVETPIESRSLGKVDYEQEIKCLRNMVRLLREREGNLQVQLLEYYGLKEQENAVLELQNQLKINATHAKLLKLKIDALHEDNQKLKGQLADFAKVKKELESARGQIKLLKKKLISEAEQNRTQILGLQKRVAKLQDEEKKNAEGNLELQWKLRKLMELEGEVQELRNSNLKSEVENSELAEKLDAKELVELKQKSECLRQENENLLKKVDQLQTDRCADAEELVYLRWLNACLRYELRNYQPPTGKTVARDLSRSLSPKSEEKAKQLILEYARSEGFPEQRINFLDFDSDQCSSSPTSLLSDSGDFDDLSVDNKSSTKNKHKFLSKLRRLIKGKDGHHHNQNLSAEKARYSEDKDWPACSSTLSTVTDTGTEEHSNRFKASLQSPSRKFLDTPCGSPKEEGIKKPPRTRRFSDLGSYRHERCLSSRESRTWLTEENLDHNSESAKKSDLVKYAAALKDSHSGTFKLHRRSASVSYF